MMPALNGKMTPIACDDVQCDLFYSAFPHENLYHMNSSSAKKMWTEDLEKKRIKPGRSKIERKNVLYVEEAYMT